MRIITGKHKGKHIVAPKSLPVRPTTDFAKVGLFNILVNNFDIENSKVLDLFSGTGSISYEFASRDCKDITAVEIAHRGVDFIRRMAKDLNYEAIRVVQADTFRFLRNQIETYDIIFADPPYDLETLGNIPDAVFDHNLLKEEGWLILEHSQNHDFSKHPKFFRLRNYGKVHFSFFSNSEPNRETSE